MVNKKRAPSTAVVVVTAIGLIASLAAAPAGGSDAGSGASPAAGPLAKPAIDALQGPMTRLVQAVEAAGGQVGVAVVDVHTGQRLLAHDADRALNPASNMKLVTAWAALHLLGPQHRYLTTLHGSKDGERIAELGVRGDGDPSLEMEHLLEMAAELRRGGVTEVGDILVDQSHFDEVYVPPTYDQQPGEWASFRAPVAAVSFARNAVLFEVRPGREGDKARVVVVPASLVDLDGQVRTSGSDDPEAVTLSLTPKGTRLQAHLGGSLSAAATVVRYWRRVDDPRLLAGYALHDACEALGIEVSGGVRAGRVPRRQARATHRSLPLSQLLHALGKQSNNFYAEMVFKSLGALEGDAPASFEAAAQRVAGLLDEHQLGDGISVRNGSGLFDGGTLTARATVRLLAAAHSDPRVGPDLVAQLSIGGLDGTLRSRLRAWRASRSVRAKSGTLAAVTALSGYVLGAGGRTLAFSVIINGVRGKAVPLRRDIDALVSAVARHVSEP